MHYSVAILTAIAVSMISVRATPVLINAREAFTPSDSFVGCVQQTSPNFPHDGNPTTQQLRACFHQSSPKKSRQLDSSNVTDIELPAMESRGLANTIEVLGKVMGIDERAKCQDDKGLPTVLHDEFVWIEDVTGISGSVCDEVNAKIEQTGIHEDGGVAYAARRFSNAHDDQNNLLKNGRHLLLTMAIDFYPPASFTRDQIKAVAKGMHDLCSGGIQKLMTPSEGCTSQVNWYVSQKAKWEKHMAAVGGQVGIFFEGSNNHVAILRLGFSEDSN